MEVLTVEPFCNEHLLRSCSEEELECGIQLQRLPANTGANMVWVGGSGERLCGVLIWPKELKASLWFPALTLDARFGLPLLLGLTSGATQT